jgi:hypothetical protein
VVGDLDTLCSRVLFPIGVVSLRGHSWILSSKGSVTLGGALNVSDDKNTVAYVLRNGAYAGLTQWDGVESKGGKMPAIISTDDYEAAQLQLAQLRRGRPGKVNA